MIFFIKHIAKNGIRCYSKRFLQLIEVLKEMNFLVFDGSDSYKYIANIRILENNLLEDCSTDKHIIDEDEDENPIFKDCRPETSEDIKNIYLKHVSYFPELQKLYENYSLTFTIPLDTMNFFTDSSEISTVFLPGLDKSYNRRDKLKKYDYKCIILRNGDEYYGHVWYFTSKEFPDFCGIYGIKTSLINILARLSGDKTRKGVAKQILQKVIEISQGKKNYCSMAITSNDSNTKIFWFY